MRWIAVSMHLRIAWVETEGEETHYNASLGSIPTSCPMFIVLFRVVLRTAKFDVGGLVVP